MTITLDLITNDLHTSLKTLFISFIDNFTCNDVFIYKIKLQTAIITKEYQIIVNLSDLQAFNSNLYDVILRDPRIVRQFEQELIRVFIQGGKRDAVETAEPMSDILFNLHFISHSTITPVRAITSNYKNKLVRLSGLVTSVSMPMHKPASLTLICRRCMCKIFTATHIPRACQPTCGTDPFCVDTLNSTYYDEQNIKLQEDFDDVLVGEMPRNLEVKFTGALVDIVRAGEKIQITGVVCVSNRNKRNEIETGMMGSKISEHEQPPIENNQSEIQKPQNLSTQNTSFVYVHVLGVEKTKSMSMNFSDAERSYFESFKAKEGIHSLLLSFYAPMIHGLDDIKKSILCLLFGGTRKNTAIPLRPDINILLLGDPGCAKSQLLKYANQLVPGMYTSGKGSSAAGLTASVLQSRNGQFRLEAGALVLSDFGLCCIDEFDKMDSNDRIAIHEAMEQQTISISKAGIVATLHSRCSVLAAANPTFGRYNNLKRFEENVEFGKTILSRFDMIFLVLDVNDKKKDFNLANALLNNRNENNLTRIWNLKEKHRDDQHTTNDSTKKRHKSGVQLVSDSSTYITSLFTSLGLFKLFNSPLDFLKRYISYCKQTYLPILNDEAKGRLKSFYVKTRETNHKIPITVRQLESLIRITESLAKMEQASVATLEHANEAIRLFSVSTLNINQNIANVDEEEIDLVVGTADMIISIMAVGVVINIDKVFLRVKQEKRIIGHAIEYLRKINKVDIRNNGNMLVRLK